MTNLAGTLALVVLVRVLGETLAHPLEAVRLFVATHVVSLTVISAVLVTSSVLLRVRRNRRARPPAGDLATKEPIHTWRR